MDERKKVKTNFAALKDILTFVGGCMYVRACVSMSVCECANEWWICV